ncbi:hypothetical protein HDIA_2700 [Hartmannibacter diazotrophicus]|uniref:TIGR01620 family protein n=1 Tax=Hartmannibacter diazotrophicus TaxID=1482074 RepID=A0A2C9D931_9HYPH|nr:TIGR01620 family protein [Hartmannibacter diazotrophicus]SON56241.1 hypothetical protein HDIA_2700 [Hartmannibacter diazotrophicus]
MNGKRETPRRPTAFRLGEDAVIVDEAGEAVSGARGDGEGGGRGRARVVMTPEPQDGSAEAVPPPPVPKRRGLPLGKLFWAGLGSLVTLGIGLAVDQLIRDLFARNDWLGWAGLGLVGLTVFAALGIVVREVVGLMRLARIEDLRLEAAAAVLADDAKAAKAVAKSLVQLYADRPETARGRSEVGLHLGEIIDGRDLMVLVENDLMVPLDRTARRLVSDTAKRVSVVTAVSPRAIVDLLFVLVAVMGLIRQLADLYGGRPGFFGFLSLARHVIAHLAVTGGMAAGDSLVQQVLGHGLAARLSSRLGEGVINGLLSTRVGLAAIDVCRPMPFIEARRPGAQDIMRSLFPEGEDKMPGSG